MREVIGEESTIPDDHPECHLSFRCFAHRPSFREKNRQVSIPSSLWISNLEDFLERYYERESTDPRADRKNSQVHASCKRLHPDDISESRALSRRFECAGPAEARRFIAMAP